MHAVCAGVKQVGGRCVPDVWQMMCGRWCVANDVWQMMCGRWCVPDDVWQMMCGRWCVADDLWQMMCGRWCVADAGQMYSTCVAGALQMCGRYMCAAANVWQFWQRQGPHMMVEKLTKYIPHTHGLSFASTAFFDCWQWNSRIYYFSIPSIM